MGRAGIMNQRNALERIWGRYYTHKVVVNVLTGYKKVVTCEYGLKRNEIAILYGTEKHCIYNL